MFCYRYSDYYFYDVFKQMYLIEKCGFLTLRMYSLISSLMDIDIQVTRTLITYMLLMHVLANNLQFYHKQIFSKR